MLFCRNANKCNFEVFKNQTATYVLMCKVNSIFRYEQVQTYFLGLFDIKKKVEVSFTDHDMTNLGGLPVLRRENHVGRRELYAIGKLFLKHFVESYHMESEIIIIDLDKSNADIHGARQFSLFNTYCGGYCYMSLFIFEGISGKLMLPLLRHGRLDKRTNQFQLFLHAAAYVLTLKTKQTVFVKHEMLDTAIILTFRKRFILQTARITEFKTKIMIEFQ